MEDSRNIIKAIDALTLKAGGEVVDSKNITEAIDNLKAVYDQHAIGLDATFTQEGLAADAKAVGDKITGIIYLGSFDITGVNTIQDFLHSVYSKVSANALAIQYKLCQQEIEALKTQNQNLQTQLNMANLAASQGNQTATLQAGQRALANEIEQYVLPTPRPAYVVQNPNCCQPVNYGCGCGVA